MSDLVGNPEDRFSHKEAHTIKTMNNKGADQTAHRHKAGLLMMSQMSRVMRKPTFWCPTWSDTNLAVQLQKMARGLKF